MKTLVVMPAILFLAGTVVAGPVVTTPINSPVNGAQTTPTVTSVAPVASQPLAVQIPSVIRTVQSAGYPLITKVSFDSGIYKVKAINMQGISADLEVDPQTGSIIKPKTNNAVRLTMLDAIKKVEGQGYHGIYEVEADSDGDYIVRALDAKGNQVSLDVNASTGDISKKWF